MDFYQTNQSEGRKALKERLTKLELGKYGIGVHGIDKGDVSEKRNIATSIIIEGINLNGSKTILGTAISLGTNYETGYMANEIAEYRFRNETVASIVIAVPTYIQNSNQETIFLGFPQRNTVRTGQQYQEHCILDRICTRLRKIPAEFVLGYFLESVDGTEHFVENPIHYSNLSDEEKEAFYQNCAVNMDDISKRFNEMIVNGQVTDLEVLKRRMEDVQIPTFLVDNAIALAKKYGVKEKTTDTVTEKGISE